MPRSTRTPGRWPKGWQVIGAGGDARLQAHDAPLLNLRNERDIYLDTALFRTYLMYRSDRPGSIWVPIGEVKWRYAASASTVLPAVRGTRWRLDDAHLTYRYAGTVIAELPQWTREWYAPKKRCGLDHGPAEL